jgi:hypothetical protein
VRLWLGMEDLMYLAGWLVLVVGILWLGRKLKRLEGRIMGQLDQLTAQVAENTSVEGSAVQLLTNLHDLLLANQNDPAAIVALAGTLKSSSDALSAAIVANTPA